MTARTIIKLEGIEKTYGAPANELRVLQDVNLRVDEAEYVAIVGPSGAGKSTLLNILGCLDQPTSGSYHLMGEDVARFGDHKLSGVRKLRLGFIFQSFRLIPHLTVLENVEMPLFYARQPRKLRRQRCLELIDRVGLGHRTTHLPSQLSGGENQRAAIARSLANDPAVILADEPTGNLDSATTRDIMALLESLNDSGRTIMIVTHDNEIAQAVPRRVTLYDGRVKHDTRGEVAA